MKNHLLLFVVALAAPAAAFSNTSDETTQGTTPQASSSTTTGSATWDIKLGGLQDYGGKSQRYYYNFSYLGESILAHGTAMSAASDYSAGGLADVTSHSGFLQFSRGIPSVGGNLLSGYNTTPFTNLLKNGLGKALEDFNIVVGVDTQVDTVQNSSYTYGVEYKAIPFLSYL